MTRKLIAGNWKMHGHRAQALPLAAAVAAYVRAEKPAADILLCPPATLLREISAAVGDTLLIGGQDCAPQEEGAYTGDISAYMLKEAGCTHVILGHSERRQYHAEDDEAVHAKAQAALKTGLIPIICVGETLLQRDRGEAETVVTMQVKAALPAGECVLAYEPVWAIGTGKTPTLTDIEAMHACIARAAGRDVQILYGGSVKPGNAKEILHLPSVGGALVGGASLSADDFCAIIPAAVRG